MKAEIRNLHTNNPNISDLLVFQLNDTERTRLDRIHCRIIKRTIDLLLGGSLAIVLFPVFIPLAGLLIAIDSRGPVFFIQKRTGKNRRTFYCLKFRTMVLNKEANRRGVVENDTRITRSGKFLRKYFIDELPQLVNVLMGDMSLVGPRPHMLMHNVEFSNKIANYHVRHKVKPGLTGLAQMRGYHGLIRDDLDLANRVSSDIEYIMNWTLLSDFKMFFRTLNHILKTIAGKE